MKARSRLRPTAFDPSTSVVTPPLRTTTGPARSRLTAATVQSNPPPRVRTTPFASFSPAQRRQLRNQSQALKEALGTGMQETISWLLKTSLRIAQRYAPYFLFLVASLPAYATTIYIVFRISPTQFQTWPAHDVYLVPQLLFFFANYFFLSFLFQNYRRAITATVLIQVLVLLKLQRFELEWWLPVVFLVLFGILELFWFVICKLRPTPSPARKKKR